MSSAAEYGLRRRGFGSNKAEDEAPPPVKTKPVNMSHQTECRLARYYAERFIHPPPPTFRVKLLTFLDSKKFCIPLVLLVFFACILTFMDLFGRAPSATLTAITDPILMVVFATEVIARIIAMGPKEYFDTPLCISDFAISCLDIIMLIFPPTEDTESVLRVVRVLRLARFARLVRLGEHAEGGAMTKGTYHGRIMSYDASTLFSLGFLQNLYGTIFKIHEIWIQFLFLFVLSTMWAVYICAEECDEDPELEGCDSCVMPLEAAVADVLSVMVAFMLGLFVNLTFKRWWSMRTLVGQLTEEVVVASNLVAIHVKGESDEAARYRFTLVRYLNLCVILWVKNIENDIDFRDLIETGKLTHSEWDLLEGKSDLHLVVMTWILELTKHISKHEGMLYSDGSSSAIGVSIAKIRALIGDVQMYMETQIPYAYTHLMTAIVKVHLLLVAGVAGTEVSAAMSNNDPLAIFLGFFIILINNMVMEGLLRIHVVLYDPFGEDCCDFPIEKYLEETWTQCHTLLHHRAKLPNWDLDEMPEPPKAPEIKPDEEYEFEYQKLEKEVERKQQALEEEAQRVLERSRDEA